MGTLTSDADEPASNCPVCKAEVTILEPRDYGVIRCAECRTRLYYFRHDKGFWLLDPAAESSQNMASWEQSGLPADVDSLAFVEAVMELEEMEPDGE